MANDNTGKSNMTTEKKHSAASLIPSILRMNNKNDKSSKNALQGRKNPPISSPIKYYIPNSSYSKQYNTNGPDDRFSLSVNILDQKQKSFHDSILPNYCQKPSNSISASANMDNTHVKQEPFQPFPRQSKPHSSTVTLPASTKPNYLKKSPSGSNEGSIPRPINLRPGSSSQQNPNFRSSPITPTVVKTTNIHEGLILPCSSSAITKLYRDKLTMYESKEIEKYPEIWYFGKDAKKIHGDSSKNFNNGYDDENGSYRKVTNDHIIYKYESLETIGRGSFGQVVKAYDHKSHVHIALKIIRNKKRFHHQALVEVKILDHLKRKDKDGTHNIIQMLEHFYFRNHLCIAFELLGINLYEMIKKNQFQGFSLTLVRKFAISLLHCLRLLYREKIIHCDLKPENILLRAKGQYTIKVIDFGSSCLEDEKIYTYIQSRFYRSPEVILGLSYGMPIDMWSFGCILVELHTGYPLFPGNDEYEQLACIMEVLNTPPAALLEDAQRKRVFFDEHNYPRQLTNSKGKYRKPHTKSLLTALKTDDQNFIDFIKRALAWDPNLRMTPDEALLHEWIQESRSAKHRPFRPTSYTPCASGYSLKDQEYGTSNANSASCIPMVQYPSDPRPVYTNTSKYGMERVLHGNSKGLKEEMPKSPKELAKENYGRHNSISTLNPEAATQFHSKYAQSNTQITGTQRKNTDAFAYSKLNNDSVKPVLMHNEGRLYSYGLTATGTGSSRSLKLSDARALKKDGIVARNSEIFMEISKKSTTPKKEYSPLTSPHSFSQSYYKDFPKSRELASKQPSTQSYLPRFSNNKDLN